MTKPKTTDTPGSQHNAKIDLGVYRCEENEKHLQNSKFAQVYLNRFRRNVPSLSSILPLSPCLTVCYKWSMSLTCSLALRSGYMCTLNKLYPKLSIGMMSAIIACLTNIQLLINSSSSVLKGSSRSSI